MIRLRLAILSIALASSTPLALHAQQRAATRTSPTRSIIARADSAYDDGDRTRARALYEEAFSLDPSLSKAAFRLGQLETSPERALAWFRRYQGLEPRDPWGVMAEGDLHGRMGKYAAALAAYARAAAMAPDERDVVIGSARWRERGGHPDAAAAELSRWTARHGDDAEAWDLQGRALMRAGRPRGAADAFGRAKSASTGATLRGLDARLANARAQAAPAIEPVAGYMRDSDGNRTSRYGGVGDVMVSDGVRLGAGAERVSVGDGVLSADGFTAHARLSARPKPGVRFDAQGGALRFASPVATGSDWTTPQGDVRLRLRAADGGPSLELRAQRMALGMAPILVENQVTRTEGRATVELPVGPLRLRGIGRAGQMSALTEPANTRVGAEGALIAPLGSTVQLSGQYRVMGFSRASTAGYFAPKRAETIDGGVYFEVGSDGPFSFAADLGAGAQRVAEQGANAGKWTRALRGWGYAAFALGPARSLYAELEAYDAPFAPEGVATVGNWRFVSLSTGVRWALR